MVEALLIATLLSVAQADEAEVAAPEPVAAPDDDNTGDDGPSGLVSLSEYQIAQVTRVEVASGRTRIGVESNAPAPRAGSFPVRFFVDNSTGPRQVITFRVQSSVAGGFHNVTRAVEIAAGERRTVNVPIPAEMRYATVSATGPGITENANSSMYFQNTYDPQRVVLSISRPEQFEKFAGKAPRYSGANVFVHPVPPDEAPDELAAYLGYDAVVVPDAATLDNLDESKRRAIEGFVATGGHLVIGGVPRSQAVFPLAKNLKAGTTHYGFGTLIITGGPSAGLDVFRENLNVSPRGPLPEYERRYNPTAAASDLLLPQATAPLGRFLLIIALFTLAIGPGSVWVARRRGPAALLVTIPGTALITCVLIIGYSLIADGFVVHSSTWGFTLLDSRSHRAITHGVTAYYANLAPSKATFGPGVVLVAPHEDRREKYVADLTWKDGLTLGGDFVPSRTYREWGFTSVEPTRARLVVKQKGKEVVLQNALGMKVDGVVVNVDGKFYSGGPVRDGGEVTLEPGNRVQYAGNVAAGRFSADVTQAVVHRSIEHGQFLARVEGAGFVPTGGLSTNLASSEQWIRGEYEE
ncbi:MAG: hypothetical protein U0228_38510 [Myxococcaceae bacterium]